MSSRSSFPDPLPWPELANRAGLGGHSDASLASVMITALADDSRRVVPGACFVAVRGAKSDGHRFLRSAVEAGASLLVVEPQADVPRGVPVLRVADSRSVLAKLASAFFGLRGGQGRCPTLIAVTGTNGKTTVAWILRSILAAANHRPALLGTVEYDVIGERWPAPLTTPGAIDLASLLATARDAGADFAVLEASSHALDQRRTDGLEFSAGVFTNLTGEHLDYHGTMAAYREAKRRLFAGLSAGATAVINRDDPTGAGMAAGLRADVVYYGLRSAGLDVTADLESTTPAGSTFVLRARTFETSMHSRLIGRHNVENVLAAAAAAECLGVAPAAIRLGVERLAGAPGRLQPVHPPDWPFSVLVDYAHTDDALRNALQAVRSLTTGRVICVFGCGGDRDRAKRPRMAAVVDELADVAFVTSDNPRTEDPGAIIADILTGFPAAPRCRPTIEPDRRRAIEAALTEAASGDAVLIAGKGHETYQLVGDRALHFDDAEVAREWLKRTAVTEAVA